MNAPSENREWIIQRCTQRWIGTQLRYEDFPASAWQKQSWRFLPVMTKEEMLKALTYCGQRWPMDEFRGHNVMNCKCHGVLGSDGNRIDRPKAEVR
jgi:hypothetical protein